MLSVALIVFREALEIVLIVSVVLAATKGLAGRNRWTLLGLAGGIAGAGLVAVSASALMRAASGIGQELFNAAILFAAAVLIGGTAVWMKSHARDAALHLKQVGHSVREGKLPLYSLAIVIALAVWREGSEIVLFLYGMAIAGQSAGAIATGSVIGLTGGIIVGIALYYGLLKIAARRMFAVTGWLLVLLAAGMASQGAKLLVDAGLLTHGITPVWNTGALLSEQSVPGQALHALIGYSAQPLGVQLVFYAATLAVLIALMRYFERRPKEPPAITAAALMLGCLLCSPDAAHAIDGEIYSPNVVQHEFEMEYAGSRTFDHDKAKNDAQENETEIGYGFTDFWELELGGDFERGPGNPQRYSATELENIFSFTEPGKYWLDAGALVSYHRSAIRDVADSVEAKLLLQKDSGLFTTIANIGGEQEVGAHAEGAPDFTLALNSRYRWLPYFEPGIELQSDVGELREHRTFSQQEHYLGPVVYGELLPHVKYDVAYLFGITQASAAGAARAHIEYEMYF